MNIVLLNFNRTQTPYYVLELWKEAETRARLVTIVNYCNHLCIQNIFVFINVTETITIEHNLYLILFL